MLHPWNVYPEEATRIQAELKQTISLRWTGHPVNAIAGVDVSMDVSIKAERARCAIVVLSFPDLIPLESGTADLPLAFPYIPGLLSFREGPVILRA